MLFHPPQLHLHWRGLSCVRTTLWQGGTQGLHLREHLFTLLFTPFWHDRHLLNQGWGPTWTRGKPILGFSVASWLSRSWLSGYWSQTRSTGLMQHMKMKLCEHGGYPGKHLRQLLLTKVSVLEQWITPAILLIALLVKHGCSAHRCARTCFPWRHPICHKNAHKQEKREYFKACSMSNVEVDGDMP